MPRNQTDKGFGESATPLQSVTLSFKVIESLLALDGATVTELATHLDIPKSTAHVHLTTLQSNGYVVKEESEYRLGFQFLTVGGELRDRMKLFHVAKSELRDLAEKTGEIVHLAIEENGRGVVLHKEEASGAIDDNAPIGTYFDLHLTAMGKAFLSGLDDDRIEEIIHHVGLSDSTQNTITDPAVLREELQTVRERGYAFNDEERTPGVRAVGVPILTNDDRTVGSISISGPRKRLSADYMTDNLVDPLLETKNIIELRLEHY